MTLAPIALFVYKRPTHTAQVLTALMQCPEFEESTLYVFCDGSKRLEDEAIVNETRAIVRSMLSEKANIVESPENKGLANSIISGVTQLVNTYGKVIVLEDDLIVKPAFLAFMNKALDTYVDEDKVMQVSGYMFPVREFSERTEALFLPFISSWGWATWKRAWQKFDPQVTNWKLLEEDKNLKKKFDLDGAYDYFSMLQDQLSGKIDSWAIRWYWSVFQEGGLTLFPPLSYVQNIGFDSTATHGVNRNRWKLKKPSPQNNYYLADCEMPQDLTYSNEEYALVKQQISNPAIKYLKILRSKFEKVIKNMPF